MEEKIFQLLKQAYSSLGLSDEILRGHAMALAGAGIVTDENVEAVVAAQKPFLASLQSGIDKRVSDAVNKAKAEKKQEPAFGGEQGKNEPDIDKLVSEAVTRHLTPLQEKLSAYEAREQLKARTGLIESHARKAGIPDWRIKEGFAVSEDMDEKAIADYMAGIKTNLVTAGLRGEDPAFPLMDGKKATDEELDAIMKEIV